MSDLHTFAVPATLKQRGRRKPLEVTCFLEAEDRADALWQAHHGVIEMNVRATWPNATVSYDLRKLLKMRKAQ